MLLVLIIQTKMHNLIWIYKMNAFLIVVDALLNLLVKDFKYEK